MHINEVKETTTALLTIHVIKLTPSADIGLGFLLKAKIWLHATVLKADDMSR